MLFSYSAVFSVASLAIQTFRPTFAAPAVTTIQSTLNTQNPSDYKYDIRLCNSTQRDFLDEAIDHALSLALKTWHDASSKSPLYETFFKNHNHPVLNTLSKVASYEAVPARGVEIFWACITPKTKAYFPRAGVDLYKACESGEVNGYTIVDSFILVCPQIFDDPPPPAQADKCPSVSNNMFSEDVEFPIYRSDIVFHALVDYVLPAQIERVVMDTLDAMSPNIRKSPWDPTLITDNTTTPILNDIRADPPPDADGKEVPNKKP
ncbi:MAG: hypothetical protein Q9213_004332 [Squamulea squamosa]